MAKRYLVPQHIEMADKLVGPMTLAQFLYLLAGGIFCYALLISGLTRIITVPLALIIGSLALALAFLKINDQPFSKMMLAFVAYSLRPKERYWEHTELPSHNLGAQNNLSKIADHVFHLGWSGEHKLGERIKSHEAIVASHQQPVAEKGGQK